MAVGGGGEATLELGGPGGGATAGGGKLKGDPPYISRIAPLYLPCISRISPLYSPIRSGKSKDGKSKGGTVWTLQLGEAAPPLRVGFEVTLRYP